MSRFLSPDHAKGDERTIGGYAAVHSRPVALEGRDGFSYSVEIMIDRTDDVSRPFGAYFLFLQWKKMGSQGIAGHLESDILTTNTNSTAARTALGAMLISDVQRILDDLIASRGSIIW